jgi:hypothetical protein
MFPPSLVGKARQATQIFLRIPWQRYISKQVKIPSPQVLGFVCHDATYFVHAMLSLSPAHHTDYYNYHFQISTLVPGTSKSPPDKSSPEHLYLLLLSHRRPQYRGSPGSPSSTKKCSPPHHMKARVSVNLRRLSDPYCRQNCYQRWCVVGLCTVPQALQDGPTFAERSS